jgi:hypothetical protein
MEGMITRIHRMQSGINFNSECAFGLSLCHVHIVLFLFFGCRTVYNKRLYSLSFSPNIIRVIETRRMRQEGHVARVGERCIQGFGVET